MRRISKKIAYLLLPLFLLISYYSLSHFYTSLPVTVPDIHDINPYFAVPGMRDKQAYDEWSRNKKWSSESKGKHNSFPFPNYSPDGRFYVTMRYQNFGWLWIMEMYRTSDNVKLGSYASHKLLFNGWRPDSSGVYVKVPEIKSFAPRL